MEAPSREYTDAVVDSLRQLATKYPQAYRMAHADENEHPEAYDFVILALRELTKQDPLLGMNGKRGNENDPSSDAFAYGRGKDVIIVDFIIAAGEHGNNLSRLTWQDVTEVSKPLGGVWLDPFKFKTFAEKNGGATLPPVNPPVKPPEVIIKEVIKPLPDRGESLDELNHLHNFYKTGLKRENGLWINDGPDFEGIAAWFMDVYLNARMHGKSRGEARKLYEDQIRNSDEWR